MTSRSRSRLVLTFVVRGLVTGLGLLASAPSQLEAAPDSGSIGTSVEGRSIEIGCLGGGDHTVLVVGGLHTGPEAHSSDLVLALAGLGWGGELDVPADARLCLIPTVNPDGVANGTRTNARGVDLNRNWPSLNWTRSAYHPLSGAVSGGAAPLSEPETRALWNYVLQTRPSVVVTLHCCGSVVEANDVVTADQFAQTYAEAAGMRHIADWTAYPVTGQFIDAMDRIGIAAIDVEMAELDSIGLDEHRVAVEASLANGARRPVVAHPRGSLSTTTASTTGDAASNERQYRVRPGDTLADIAARHGTTASALAALNRLVRPDLIEVGQLLAIAS